MKPQMYADKHGYGNKFFALRLYGRNHVSRKGAKTLSRWIFILSALICVHLWLIFLASCASKPTNLRSLAPADSLVYLETNDLAAALQPVIDAKPFADVAKSKPDLSALKGVQLAVVVTGFETKEEKVSDESSIGRIQPHFAAIADTHSWSWATKSFAEDQLGEFINNVYGGGVDLDTKPQNGGVYYTWKAEDGRKAYAFVDGSLIYFGNDESSIEKCLAVRRGKADSILKNPKLPAADPSALAYGYITTDGVGQIANLAGILMASQTGEEQEVKTFIASALPQILRSSVTDVSWTMSKTDQGIEDEYLISTPTDISNVLNESMATGPTVDEEFFSKISNDLPTMTLYNFKDPSVAWKSVLFLLQKQTDPSASVILTKFSSVLFEPYGIANPELFMTAAGPAMLTANADAEGEKPFVVAAIRDEEGIKKAFLPEIKPPRGVTKEGIAFWLDENNEFSATFSRTQVFVGAYHGVGSCFEIGMFPVKPLTGDALQKLTQSTAPITTVGRDKSVAIRVVELLSDKKSEDAKTENQYLTKTRFTKNGIERKTVSDFGLIGSIIAQLAPED